MKRILYNRVKYAFLFSCLSVLLVCLSAPGYAGAQEILQRKVTLNLRRATLESVLNLLEKQANVPFTYQATLVVGTPLVTIRAKEEPLSTVLERILTPTALEYRLVGGHVVLQKRQQVSALTASSPERPVSRPIRGRITDEKGQALTGVNVLVKGTTIGTETDASGEFKLQIPDGNQTLLLSYVGYETASVAVGNQSSVEVSLKPNLTSLSEVVVVGYGVQRKSDITGSVASVKMKDIEKAPSSRIDQSLQGRIAGVVIQTTDASPNAQTAVRIRGASSINGGNDPLVVIDGMQGGSLTTLNPADVASVEVLKDASATAVYGSRGANGVIIVTTKKGEKGKPVIGFNSYLSMTQVRRKLDQMSPYDYAETVNASRQDYGLPTVFSATDLAGFKNGAGTNWQDQIFRKGAIRNYQVSVSGADESVSYYVSANALDQKGLVLNSSYQRFGLRSNLKADLSKRLSVQLNAFLNRETDHPIAQNSFSGGNAGSPIFSALLWAPVKTVYDANGNYTLPGGGYGPNTNYNPVALAVEPIRNYYTTTTNVTGNINYRLAPGLTLNVLGSYRSLESERNDYYNSKPTQAPGSEIASIVNQRTLFLQNTNMLTYEKSLGSGHQLKLTGVVEQQYERNNGSFAGAIGYSTDALTYNNLSLGSSPQVPTSFLNTRTLMSYLGRVNYSFREKYLLTASLRADGSSVFGASNKWGKFPSVALGWNISREPFMAGLSNSVTDLKLRGSYGLVGNQAIQPYQSLATLNTNAYYPINGQTLSTGVGVGGVANPNLRWEKTAQANVGIDATLGGGRVDVTVDYYRKETKDLLLAVPMPMASGGNGTVLKNVGSVENKGVELLLNIRPLRDRSVWQTGFTFALNRNKVLALAEGQTEILLGNPGLPGFAKSLWLQVGQPLGLFRGYQYTGVWKTAEAEQAKKFGAVPGDSKYVDQNGDGVIDEKDIVNIGNAQPKFSFGWNNTFSFKNFDLNIFLQGVQGNHIYNLSRVRFESFSSDGDPTSRRVLDRWTPTNENTDVPTFKGGNDGKLNSSRWLEDGSYVRLKNVALGYTMPKSLVQSLGLNHCRVYLSATNWLTWTKYSGFDPESSSGIDTRAGVDLATYPAQKTLTIGLDIKF